MGSFFGVNAALFPYEARRARAGAFMGPDFSRLWWFFGGLGLRLVFEVFLRIGVLGFRVVQGSGF